MADALPADAVAVDAPVTDFDFDLDFDLDGIPYLLQDFFHDVPTPPPSTHAEAVDSPAAEGSVASSEGSVASASDPFMSDLEKFLMEDADADADADAEGAVVDDGGEFFAQLFGQDSGVDEEVADPGTATAIEAAEKKVVPKRATDGEEGEVDEGSDDDPISKKRRRQMRNRDSAMKSRERKKAYVKDLEMKSKYLEAECRRLCYALQYYAAENMALHQRLQNGKVIGASVAKQESAVLFVESLLLGSLFCLVSIISLLLIPSPPNHKSSGLERDLVQGVMAKGVANEQEGHVEIPVVILRKKCRGMRTRIKASFFHGSSRLQGCLIRC